jgi:hypothetical protein
MIEFFLNDFSCDFFNDCKENKYVIYFPIQIYTSTTFFLMFDFDFEHIFLLE